MISSLDKLCSTCPHQNTYISFWTQLFFLCFKQTPRALLDIHLDTYKCVEKLHSPFVLITSLKRSITLLAFFVSFLKIACLHVPFTAYENFYKLSKIYCLLIFIATCFPSEVSEIRNSTIKLISTYTLFHPSESTYVVDHFLVISCLYLSLSECQGLSQM